jgi:hypothetical protein
VLGANNSVLSVTGYTVNDGNSGANYSVSSATAAGTITPAALAINAVTDTKVYDGGTTSAGVVSVGPVFGTDSVTGTIQAFGSKNVLGANNSVLSVTGYTVNDGNSGANYSVSSATAAGTITPAALTVTADNQSKIFGISFNFTGNEFTSAGMQNSETIGSVTLASAGQPATATVAGSPYAITASNATGGSFTPSNYNINYVDGLMTVNSVTPPPAPQASLSPTSDPVIQAINSSVVDPNTVAYGTRGSVTITGFLNTLPPTAAGPADGDERAAQVEEQTAQRELADRGCFASGPLTFRMCQNRWNR